ncbi:histidine--tRNA ligase [Rurimicrobium arvi]|uniref:Histidine--tRNA ligase n=1 Tax=Rurimicrobium arvi TaxID=2049916 RepID=A0ABP8MKB8_9BACT
MSKPSIPQGTRDLSPEVVRKRQFLLQTLRSIFETCGFQPIETPAMENLSTLMGKYGDEGDRLIFKILNNGLQEPSKQEKTRAALEQVLLGKNDTNLTERALRYDLTIPFARYVVMHQNEIQFPFRRYQMQPVWRADRPQKGRYREFWQCDCDIVGSNSLINEAELLAIYREAFAKLAIPDIVVRLNSRKILTGIAQYCGAEEKLVDITTAIDKLDKIGHAGVQKELSERGLSDEQIGDISELIGLSSLDAMEQAFEKKQISTGMAGIGELRNTLNYHEQLQQVSWTNSKVEIDFTLARGLSYYTGVIVEVICANDRVQMGSIGGGGRYDDLTGLFGLKNLSGVGVSFGIDRIYDVMEQLQLFPETLNVGTQVIVINNGGTNEIYALSLLNHLRVQGISSEIYTDNAKFDKQMKYAFNRGIPYVVIAEDEEQHTGTIRVKQFGGDGQERMTIDALVARLK